MTVRRTDSFQTIKSKSKLKLKLNPHFPGNRLRPAHHFTRARTCHRIIRHLPVATSVRTVGNGNME